VWKRARETTSLRQRFALEDFSAAVTRSTERDQVRQLVVASVVDGANVMNA
jgi:hypothetical protein